MSLKFNNLDNVSLDDLESDSEFIPLMTSEDEEALEKEKLPEVLPILPLINTVLFFSVIFFRLETSSITILIFSLLLQYHTFY